MPFGYKPRLTCTESTLAGRGKIEYPVKLRERGGMVDGYKEEV